MLRAYISYSLTLISAFMVWWIFGLFATVAAGYTWLPFTAFLASIIQFGISSWLFLSLPKAGKILSIIVALIMCAWPVASLFSQGEKDIFTATYFLIVFTICATVIYNHIKTFKESQKPKPLVRLILSIIPFAIFIMYVVTTYKYFV